MKLKSETNLICKSLKKDGGMTFKSNCMWRNKNLHDGCNSSESFFRCTSWSHVYEFVCIIRYPFQCHACVHSLFIICSFNNSNVLSSISIHKFLQLLFVNEHKAHTEMYYTTQMCRKKAITRRMALGGCMETCFCLYFVCSFWQ